MAHVTLTLEEYQELLDKNEELEERVQQIEDKLFGDENQTGLYKETEEDETEFPIN